MEPIVKRRVIAVMTLLATLLIVIAAGNMASARFV